jgi:hypothetical protein
MYNIQQLKNDLTGAIHNTTLNQIVNLNGVINRASRQLLLDCDPQETKRTLEFINPVFNSVFDYPIAPDVKGNAIIDIRPQVRRIPRDIWSQQYNQAFDVAKQNIYASANGFTMNFNSGIKTLRINSPFLNPPVIINNAESTNDNGTWTVGGTAINLSTNNVNYVQGNGSLQFDITSGIGWIENSTMQSVNLAAVLNQAYLFLNAYVPTATALSSVELRWGTDSSDYYVLSANQTQQATAFQNGWNFLQYIWNNAIVVGTPNPAEINYVRVSLTVTADMTACLINGIDSILGTILEYEYYSKYLFRDAITGAFQETVTDDSNLINLDTETYNLLFNLTAFLAIQQQQGLDASFYDGNFFGSAYQDTLAKYKARYKSELQKPQSVYYGMPPKGYDRVIGRGFNR